MSFLFVILLVETQSHGNLTVCGSTGRLDVVVSDIEQIKVIARTIEAALGHHIALGATFASRLLGVLVVSRMKSKQQQQIDSK